MWTTYHWQNYFVMDELCLDSSKKKKMFSLYKEFKDWKSMNRQIVENGITVTDSTILIIYIEDFHISIKKNNFNSWQLQPTKY